MPKYTLSTGGTSVSLRCDAAYERHARWFLDRLNKQQARGKPLSPGLCIRLGWSVLTLRQGQQGLVVCEPDFDSDPLKKVRTDVTTTFAVFDKQNAVLEMAGLEEGQPVRFDETVFAASGCLEDEQLLASRQVDNEGESAWFITPVGAEIDAGALEELPVYQLLTLRPALLPLLALPPGYVAVLRGDKVIWIRDDQEQDAYEASDA